ncbi:MAG: PHP domain-containing protein [Petrotogales bacterium]
MLIDLHTHTTGSDGSYKPEELIQSAYSKNIEVLSITDHDTLDGVKSLLKELSSTNDERLNNDRDPKMFSNDFTQNPTPNSQQRFYVVSSMDDERWTVDKTKIFSNILVFFPGVEISAEFPKTLHILGYGIDIANNKLNSTLKELQNYRLSRNKRMIKNMNSLGFEITLEELQKKAGGELIGRPHFAQLMLEKGYVDSYQEAFDKYLKKGAPLYMNKKRLDPDKAIELILQAGGIPVLAHPYQTKLNDEDLHSLIKELVSYGLKGIEAFYSEHTEEMTGKYLQYAKEFNLLVTAGSDFHGDNKPETELGMKVPYCFLQKFLCEIKDNYWLIAHSE